ncbi:hypothetical protein [Sphingopyxis sp. GW247-27LB]|uniref:hypothetical protein n=1 Tax=Sphingopyxis sp. GW247-27LB TaxID=2012632 RepID=UPI000BA55736|nr:hypothetical protein [Sphingopyxis sp. GW247-27LB]PAL20639.1 hypothetical protein CD928_16025 [Sphingopyxis sp. GW247-27LB]
MSGPKVVRIVTREEILTICEGQLARVDAALAAWRRIGERNDCLDEPALAAALRRRDALAAHIAADRFLELQKEAPLEEAFLRDDIDKRLADIAAREAAGRSRGRRQKEAGQSLLAALGAAGELIDVDLRKDLEAGDTTAIAVALKALGYKSERSAADREQAARLGEGIIRQNLADWRGATETNEKDPEIERLDTHISEIALLMPSAASDDWRARLDTAATAEDGQRSLLLDALAGDVRRTLETARKHRRAIVDLSGLLAEAEAAGLAVAQWNNDIDQLDAADAERRAIEVRVALDQWRAARAAQGRRAAVLEALAGMGYEVREEMSAAWAADGALLLSNPARPGYGMEVRGGGQSAERIQMRAVAFEANGVGPDRGRDRDAETLWCGDISRLRERLTEAGDEFAIERALEIGATPLKRVAIAGDYGPAGTSLPVPGKRTRPHP